LIWFFNFFGLFILVSEFLKGSIWHSYFLKLINLVLPIILAHVVCIVINDHCATN